VIATLRKENLVARAGELGRTLLDGFRKAFAGNTHVIEVRGKGLMIGIELDAPCAELTQRALDQGFLINVTAKRTIRLLPPLILSDDETQYLIDGVVRLVNDFTAR
jgi:acetylornithine aminotransferase